MNLASGYASTSSVAKKAGTSQRTWSTPQGPRQQGLVCAILQGQRVWPLSYVIVRKPLIELGSAEWFALAKVLGS